MFRVLRNRYPKSISTLERRSVSVILLELGARGITLQHKNPTATPMTEVWKSLLILSMAIVYRGAHGMAVLKL